MTDVVNDDILGFSDVSGIMVVFMKEPVFVVSELGIVCVTIVDNVE